MVEMGKQRRFELLAILDFNNVRKRMSVIGEVSINLLLSAITCTVVNDQITQELVLKRCVGGCMCKGMPRDITCTLWLCLEMV